MTAGPEGVSADTATATRKARSTRSLTGTIPACLQKDVEESREPDARTGTDMTKGRKAQRGRTSFTVLLAAALLGGLVAIYGQQWLERPRVVSGPGPEPPRPVAAGGDLPAGQKAALP